MSAIAALKGYRTQFLYSLHYILSNISGDFIFRLEGEEDLDILDGNGQLIYAIQLKNLGKTITLSDLLSENKTSFIKRFLAKYSKATPVLVSYSEISAELKSWNQHKNTISEKEKSTLKKYRITVDEWKLVKDKTLFKQINEQVIAEEVEKMMKDNFLLIDPTPTIGFLLNWLQFIAEKQQPITTKEFYNKIEDFAQYITQRIAISNQYGLVLKALHKVSTDDINQQLLEKEFYNATLTRYEHILLGLEVNRELYLEKILNDLKENNTIIVKGASGQGKTALLYSYVNRYINDWLSFELNIQQDPISTQQSIQAIASISKKLDISTVFVINVNPNTTEWIQIVKEAAHFNHVKFLIAIRNEDWYRASAIGIEFEYKEIDLSLSKNEAEIIYSKLNERNKISRYTDFEEVWIQLGDNAPLLEFVYTITQGDSLHNKLKQQVQQILKEDRISNNQQIEFLRIVSLADSLGAKIDATKLDSNIDYQFIIEKLENEYLIKKSSDKKYIQGLHIVRSQKLVEILFDEFTNSKEEYAYKCITLLEEQDLYLFHLQLFYLEIFKPDQYILNFSKKVAIYNWAVYASIIKSLIWAGTQQYVKNNRAVIDECRTNFGGAWMMFLDFMFESNFDRTGILELLKVDDERRRKIDDLNARLQPKENVFNFASDAINLLCFPAELPTTIFEWKSFGEAIFWIGNISNNKEKTTFFTDIEFETAFKIMDSKSLSKLMLGMHSYSPYLNSIREKYHNYFVEHVKSEYDVIHLYVDGNEVNVNYIIDILKNDVERSTNDYIVKILNIIRTALPDKKKFNSQGYGHRLQTLSFDHDSTHKTMPIENMPLEEWTNINSSFLKLYEYENRPENWSEYMSQLNQWESLIKEKINEFNKCFDQLFKVNKTYTPLVPVMQNLLFESSENIKEPKSITDSLGIYGGKKNDLRSENEREKQNEKLQSKFQRFFKSQSDFKSNIENFIKQSAQTIASKIKVMNEEGHIHDENTERLSQINLYNSIETLKKYNSEYESTLKNIDANHGSKIEANTLLTAATFWKDFLTDNAKGEHSFKRILKLKSDFDTRIIKDCKQASKSSPFSIRYVNSKSADDKPILLIDSKSTFDTLLGYIQAYNIIHNAINNPEYTNLKYLMLQLWFSNIYFIQTVRGKSVSNQWNDLKLYVIKDKLFEELTFINSMPTPIEEHILKNLNIESWSKLYPEFNDISKSSEAYGQMLLLVDHFYDLRLFEKIELEESDHEKLKEYVDKVGSELKKSFQIVIDSLAVWMSMFPFDEEVYSNNEEEQEYFKAIINIKDYIFPQPKGDEEDYELVINQKIIAEWVERLKMCTQSWAMFVILLSNKYINKYNLEN